MKMFPDINMDALAEAYYAKYDQAFYDDEAEEDEEEDEGNGDEDQ